MAAFLGYNKGVKQTLFMLTKIVSAMTTILKVMFVVVALGWASGLLAQRTDEATGVVVEQQLTIELIAVYPNPATKRLLVEFSAPELGAELSLRIKNSEGKVVLQRNLVTDLGGNMVILSVEHLPSGEYTLLLDEGRKARITVWQKM